MTATDRQRLHASDKCREMTANEGAKQAAPGLEQFGTMGANRFYSGNRVLQLSIPKSLKATSVHTVLNLFTAVVAHLAYGVCPQEHCLHMPPRGLPTLHITRPFQQPISNTGNNTSTAVDDVLQSGIQRDQLCCANAGPTLPN